MRRRTLLFLGAIGILAAGTALLLNRSRQGTESTAPENPRPTGSPAGDAPSNTAEVPRSQVPPPAGSAGEDRFSWTLYLERHAAGPVAARLDPYFRRTREGRMVRDFIALSMTMQEDDAEAEEVETEIQEQLIRQPKLASAALLEAHEKLPDGAEEERWQLARAAYRMLVFQSDPQLAPAQGRELEEGAELARELLLREALRPAPDTANGARNVRFAITKYLGSTPDPQERREALRRAIQTQPEGTTREWLKDLLEEQSSR